MTADIISKLTKFLDENLYEEVINYCNQKLAMIDTEHFDNLTLAKIYCAKGIAEFNLEDTQAAINRIV